MMERFLTNISAFIAGVCIVFLLMVPESRAQVVTMGYQYGPNCYQYFSQANNAWMQDHAFETIGIGSDHYMTISRVYDRSTDLWTVTRRNYTAPFAAYGTPNVQTFSSSDLTGNSYMECVVPDNGLGFVSADLFSQSKILRENFFLIGCVIVCFIGFRSGQAIL